MKKGIIVTFMALFAALAVTTVAAAAPTYMSVATGGTSGTYYVVGGAIASAITKGGKIQCTAETGNASVANLNLVATEGIEIAFVQNDIAYWAYNGELMFQGKPAKNIRAVASLYPEHIQAVVTKESGIKTLADLKGKRVGIGAPGSGVEGDVQAIFKVAGLTYDDLAKADFLDFAATTSRFKDNQIDAGFVVAGYPTASIMDLTTTKDVTLLSFDDEMLATENYFEKEGGAPSGEACAEKTGGAPAEETGGAQAADGLCSGGPCADDGAREGKAAAADGGQEEGAESGARDGNAQARAVTGENAQTLFRLHGGENAEPCYYDRVRADLDALFARHPAERELADCIPYSRWARVNFARNKYYAVGVICDEKKPQYICYGVPAEAHGEPPAALKGFCSFLPLSVFEPEGRGYWMMFQDAETGRCVRIERK